MKARFFMGLCDDHTEEDKQRAILAKGGLWEESHFHKSETKKIFFDPEGYFFFDLDLPFVMPIGSEIFGRSFDEHGLFGDTAPIITNVMLMADSGYLIYEIKPALSNLFDRIYETEQVVKSIKKKLDA